MANGWTTQRQTKQAERIHHWQPWTRSTGPRTTEGKARSSQNARRGKNWLTLREAMKSLNIAMTEQRQLLLTVRTKI